MSVTLQPLIAYDVFVSYGARMVLSGVDLRASPGQRVGLVGENGSGKSTLMRVLAGEQQPNGGTLRRPVDLVHLPQDPVFTPGATVGAVLDQALAPLHEAVRSVERLGAALARGGDEQSYVDALAWAEDHDAWDADWHADLAAERLGVRLFDSHARSSPCPVGSAAGSRWLPF